MPKQPKVRSNDPNRRKGTRGGAFAALAQQTQAPDTTQKYSSAGPELVVNNTTSDTLVVGKTYGGPVGQSTWSELSQLLGAGMQAATTGAQISAQIAEKTERADIASDTEALRELETAQAQLLLDTQKLNEDEQHAEMGILLNSFNSRFVSDEAQHKQNLRGLTHELGTTHADATTWMRTNITNAVDLARVTYSSDPEELANKIADIYKTGGQQVLKKFGEDSRQYGDYVKMIAGGMESSAQLTQRTARNMVIDNKDEIAQARSRIVERMSMGEDVLGALGITSGSSLADFATAIYEEAGLDLEGLDPAQSSAVLREFRGMALDDLKDDLRALQNADDSRIQQRAEDHLGAEIDMWNVNSEGYLSEEQIDALMSARAQFASTDPLPHALAETDSGLIRNFIEGSITRLDINMSDEERQNYVSMEVGKMLTSWNYDNDDPLSKRVRAQATRLLKETDFNVIRKHLEKQDHVALLRMGGRGNGPEAELAFRLGMEQMGITMSDLAGQETIMLFNKKEQSFDSNDRLSSLSDAIGNNAYRMTEVQASYAKDAMSFAFREAVNGGDFAEVFKETLTQDGLGDRFESLMSAVSASKSAGLLHILDQHRNDNVSRDLTVRNAMDLYKELGGEMKNGNLAGGLKVSTEDSRADEALSKANGQRAFGARISQQMGPRAAVQDRALYTQDVNGFITRLVSAPGFVNKMQNEPDTATRLAILNNAFTARYGQAPPTIALEMMEQQLNEGGFKNDEQAQIVGDIADVFAQSQKASLNKAVTQNRDFTGDWSNYKDNLSLLGSLSRFVPPGNAITPESIGGWASQRGLVVGEDEGGRITILPDPERSGQDLLLSLNELGPGDGNRGNVVRKATYNPEAKEALDEYSSSLQILEDRYAIQNPGSVKSMRVFTEALISNPGMALNAPASKFGLEGEEAITFDRLRNVIRGKRSSTADTNNIEHGRMALASALISEEIPVDEWTMETFDRANDNMIRGSDGSLTFVIPGEKGDAEMRLIVPQAFAKAFGGVQRNRNSALTGSPPNKTFNPDPVFAFQFQKEQTDKIQKEIRARLGEEKAHTDPRYIAEWTGKENYPKNAPDGYQYPFADQALGINEDNQYSY